MWRAVSKMKQPKLRLRQSDTRGSIKRLTRSPARFTTVSWLLSLADTSAMLFLRAWCMVSAARVAPPATPTMHLARLLVLTVMVKKIGYMGAIISRNMAVSLRMSAKSLHCFALQSNLLPFHQAKMMRPNMPVESFTSQVDVAAETEAFALPTPKPCNTAWVAREPERLEAKA